MSDDQLTILVVDDDDGDRKQVLRALKQSELSCHVVEASDMKEAQAACQEQTFDCAIVDFHMPGQDGLIGISVFQKQFPYMATIMLTGQGDETVASDVMKRGASDYITKDHVDHPTFQRIIPNVIEKSSLRRKLAQQHEELQNFARLLAHDMKAPTQHIQNMIGFIREKMVDQPFDEEVVKYLSYVSHAASMMDALVDALAAYTKFDTDVEFDEVPLDESVACAASLLENEITEKRGKITFKDLPMINGHEPQIIQLFQNLIANALKYNESDQPTITISTENENGVARILVQDNGIGMLEKHCTKIFEPFKRLHGNDSPYAGSGLGLATCKKIVERHGGTIACKSEKGQGTTFMITFPSYSAESVVK